MAQSPQPRKNPVISVTSHYEADKLADEVSVQITGRSLSDGQALQIEQLFRETAKEVGLKLSHIDYHLKKWGPREGVFRNSEVAFQLFHLSPDRPYGKDDLEKLAQHLKEKIQRSGVLDKKL